MQIYADLQRWAFLSYSGYSMVKNTAIIVWVVVLLFAFLYSSRSNNDDDKYNFQ